MTGHGVSHVVSVQMKNHVIGEERMNLFHVLWLNPIRTCFHFIIRLPLHKVNQVISKLFCTKFSVQQQIRYEDCYSPIMDSLKL